MISQIWSIIKRKSIPLTNSSLSKICDTLATLFDQLGSQIKVTVSFYKDYRVLTEKSREILKKKYLHVWKKKSVSDAQWEIVRGQRDDILAVPHIQQVVQLLKKTKLSKPSILEIGCSSGYHHEAF